MNSRSIPERYDAIVVLGAALRQGGSASPTLVARVRHAAALLHAGAAEWLIVTGGARAGGPAEADVMAALARAAGVPEERVLVEDRAQNTFENARYSAAMMRARGWSRAIVVTDRYHLRRAVLAFRACGVNARGDASETSPVGLRRHVREAFGLAWYAMRALPALWHRP